MMPNDQEIEERVRAFFEEPHRGSHFSSDVMACPSCGPPLVEILKRVRHEAYEAGAAYVRNKYEAVLSGHPKVYEGRG